MIRLLMILLLVVSCQPKIHGPNYNQGNSHNERQSNRLSIVMKEDARSKKQMARTRKRCKPKTKKVKHKKGNKYIK